MRLKEGFALRQIVDTWVVLPLGEATVDFNGMLTLNESSAMLWRVLEKNGDREALVDALTSEYDVTREQAAIDVDEFLDGLLQAGCIETE